jgi:hypothetical protein
MDQCSNNVEYDEFCRQLVRHPRNVVDFLSSPGIHNDPDVPNGLPHSRPPFFAWRGDIYHIKSCSMGEETRWSTILVLIGIHEGPNERTEVR